MSKYGKQNTKTKKVYCFFSVLVAVAIASSSLLKLPNNVSKAFNLHWISLVSYTLFFIRILFFPAQAEYSYFSADFRLKIFLYYS